MKLTSSRYSNKNRRVKSAPPKNPETTKLRKMTTLSDIRLRSPSPVARQNHTASRPCYALFQLLAGPGKAEKISG